MDLPAHQLTVTLLMTPDTANCSGNVHGGHVLKWLDQVAYACASRYAARYVVTVSVDQSPSVVRRGKGHARCLRLRPCCALSYTNPVR